MQIGCSHHLCWISRDFNSSRGQAAIGFLSKENGPSDRSNESQKLVRVTFMKGRTCKKHSNQWQNNKKNIIHTLDPLGSIRWFHSRCAGNCCPCSWALSMWAKVPLALGYQKLLHYLDWEAAPVKLNHLLVPASAQFGYSQARESGYGKGLLFWGSDHVFRSTLWHE
jgi:hypothetical protein